MVLLLLLLSAILSSCPMLSHAQPTPAASAFIRVLAFGDSLTAGWHEVGEPYYPYAKKLGELLEKQMPGKIQVVGGRGGRRGWCLYPSLSQFR